MSELLITSSLGPIEEGQVFSEGLPRHVTIWQYFQLPDFHRQAFIEEASEAIEGFSPLEIIGGQEDRFGPNNDVRVRRIETIGKGATLITLHTVLGEMIQRHEGTVRSPAGDLAYVAQIEHCIGIACRRTDQVEGNTVFRLA